MHVPLLRCSIMHVLSWPPLPCLQCAAPFQLCIASRQARLLQLTPPRSVACLQSGKSFTLQLILSMLEQHPVLGLGKQGEVAILQLDGQWDLSDTVSNPAVQTSLV